MNFRHSFIRATKPTSEKPEPLVLPHYMAMELEAIRDGKPSPTGRDQAGIDAEAAAGILVTSFIMPKP